MFFTILNATSLEHFNSSQRLTLCSSLCSLLDYEFVSPQKNLYMNWFMHYTCVFVYTYVLCCIQLFATSWTVAHQAPLSMEFSRQEYWSGLPFPSPGDLPHPGIKSACFVSPALTDRFITAPPGKAHIVSSFLYLSMLWQ